MSVFNNQYSPFEERKAVTGSPAGACFPFFMLSWRCQGQVKTAFFVPPVPDLRIYVPGAAFSGSPGEKDWRFTKRKKEPRNKVPRFLKSDRRGSNSRSPPWQGGALPTKLLSHLHQLPADLMILLHRFCVVKRKFQIILTQIILKRSF